MIEAWLARLPDNDEAPRDSLRDLIAMGKAQIWPSERTACITELIDNDRGRWVHFWVAGGPVGSLAELMSMLPGIEAWGRAQGCAFASLSGRRGWEREMRASGYVREGDELVKAL